MCSPVILLVTFLQIFRKKQKYCIVALQALTHCATNNWNMDLFAKYGGQEGHSDIHAVLSLTEICSPGVCIHLRTDETKGKIKLLWKVFAFWMSFAAQ